METSFNFVGADLLTAGKLKAILAQVSDETLILICTDSNAVMAPEQVIQQSITSVPEDWQELDALEDRVLTVDYSDESQIAVEFLVEANDVLILSL